MQTYDEPLLNIPRAMQSADRAFFENVFDNKGLTEAEVYLTKQMLRDPLWRPLCELAMNGVTSLDGALMLRASGLVERRAFTVRAGYARGTPVAGIDLSENGRVQFEEYFGAADDDAVATFKRNLVSSTMAYFAIDMGAGLVATQSAIEGALQFDDWELLSRLRNILDGGPLFLSCPQYEDCIDREEYVEYLSEGDGTRAGVEIIDLSQS